MLLTSPAAHAKAAPTGDFAVTASGVTYNPAAGRDVRVQDLTVKGRIAVRGVNVGFDIDAATFGVYDYTLTGAPSADRMVTSPTVIFVSEVPTLTAAQLANPKLFYFVNPFTKKINFGDGQDPVASGANAHQMLLGKDSPQVATKTFQDGTTTRWTVQSGGRIGGVLGEDAIELSPGATNCTSKCQAQNQVRGSLPVPPLPTDPTPIGA